MTCVQGLLRLLWGGPEVGVLRDWTSVYQKPTFTGQYLRWESFSPLKRKISLISTLVHRALMICTKRRLNGEIERIKKILLDNGYPKNINDAQITKKIAQFSTLK